MALWVLWKSNTIYKLYSLHFDLRHLESVWDSNWTGTALELKDNEEPPNFLESDPVDPTEKWLEYFFSPGRFTPEVLETALSLYHDVAKTKQGATLSKSSASLKQRIASALSDSVPLRQLSDSEMDFVRYPRETDGNWKQYWQIAEAINKKRHEAISLAYDTYADLPWLILTDGCVLIRECSSTELLLHNDGRSLRKSRRTVESIWPHRNLVRELGERMEDSGRLISVATSFRQKLAPEIKQACQTAFNSELFTEPFSPAPERVATFYSQCGFSDLMSDDAFDRAYAGIDNDVGLKNLSTDVFFAIVDTLPLGFPGKDSDLVSTDCGRAAVVRGAMETISLSRKILQDLILLAVFIESEVAVEDRKKFDGIEVFATLIDLLKEYEMMHWLGSNVRPSPEKSRSSGVTEVSTSGTAKDSNDKRTSSILEDLFAIHIKPRPAIGISHSYMVTQQIRDTISWVTRQGEVELPNILVFIQCDLLASGNIDLASDFLRFQPNTAWSTYVKGRIYVAKLEFDIAATYFQKAAYILCK